MFGSLSAGILSDAVFGHRRPPVAFVYYIILTFTYVAMIWCNTGWAFAFLVAVAAIWLNGLNGLITSTCAMDFAGSAATGTAVGLLDGVQKVGSSLTGSLMGLILDSKTPGSSQASSASFEPLITRKNYEHWVESLIPAALLATILLLCIINRAPPSQEKPKAIPGSCVEKECVSNDVEKQPEVKSG